MKINKFEDIESWKKSRELVNLVYKITIEYPFNNDFGLRDQIQRASVSIMSNTCLPQARSPKVLIVEQTNHL